jgi:glycosyltransferase involved in cell wall biosynthesis
MIKVELINDQPEHSGTGVYAWNLFRALSGLADSRMSFYDFRNGVCRIIGSRGEGSPIKSRFPRIKPLFWWDCHRRIPHRDLSHFVSQNLSFLRTEGRRIVTCLDLIPLVMPEKPGERLWRRLLYSGVRNADHVISISEHTKRDLMRIYRLPADRITAIPLGVSGEFRPRDKVTCRRELGLPVDSKIVLHVGTAARRKNFPTVCRASALAKRSVKGLKLVKVGQVSEGDLRLAATLDLGDGMMVRDRVPAGQLPLYYSAADVFLFPSTYEGFGLPALEAMASGCPVVASNATSLPEVVGQAGMLHEPGDTGGMAGSLRKILGDKEEHRRLAGAGLKRAALFTWERTARGTIAAYRLAAGEGR